MVLGTSCTLSFLKISYDNKFEDEGHKAGGTGVLGAIIVAIICLFIGLTIWWIYAMIKFTFPKHYVILVFILGCFIDPLVGIIAAYVFRIKK